MKYLVSSIIFALVITGFAQPAYEVTNTNSSGPGSFQAAVDSVNNYAGTSAVIQGFGLSGAITIDETVVFNKGVQLFLPNDLVLSAPNIDTIFIFENDVLLPAINVASDQNTIVFRGGFVNIQNADLKAKLILDQVDSSLIITNDLTSIDIIGGQKHSVSSNFITNGDFGVRIRDVNSTLSSRIENNQLGISRAEQFAALNGAGIIVSNSTFNSLQILSNAILNRNSSLTDPVAGFNAVELNNVSGNIEVSYNYLGRNQFSTVTWAQSTGLIWLRDINTQNGMLKVNNNNFYDSREGGIRVERVTGSSEINYNIFEERVIGDAIHLEGVNNSLIKGNRVEKHWDHHGRNEGYAMKLINCSNDSIQFNYLGVNPTFDGIEINEVGGTGLYLDANSSNNFIQLNSIGQTSRYGIELDNSNNQLLQNQISCAYLGEISINPNPLSNSTLSLSRNQTLIQSLKLFNHNIPLGNRILLYAKDTCAPNRVSAQFPQLFVDSLRVFTNDTIVYDFDQQKAEAFAGLQFYALALDNSHNILGVSGLSENQGFDVINLNSTGSGSFKSALDSYYQNANNHTITFDPQLQGLIEFPDTVITISESLEIIGSADVTVNFPRETGRYVNATASSFSVSKLNFTKTGGGSNFEIDGSIDAVIDSVRIGGFLDVKNTNSFVFNNSHAGWSEISQVNSISMDSSWFGSGVLEISNNASNTSINIKRCLFGFDYNKNRFYVAGNPLTINGCDGCNIQVDSCYIIGGNSQSFDNTAKGIWLHSIINSTAMIRNNRIAADLNDTSIVTSGWVQGTAIEIDSLYNSELNITNNYVGWAFRHAIDLFKVENNVSISNNWLSTFRNPIKSTGGIRLVESRGVLIEGNKAIIGNDVLDSDPLGHGFGLQLIHSHNNSILNNDIGIAAYNGLLDTLGTDSTGILIDELSTGNLFRDNIIGFSHDYGIRVANMNNSFLRNFFVCNEKGDILAQANDLNGEAIIELVINEDSIPQFLNISGLPDSDQFIAHIYRDLGCSPSSIQEIRSSYIDSVIIVNGSATYAFTNQLRTLDKNDSELGFKIILGNGTSALQTLNSTTIAVITNIEAEQQKLSGHFYPNPTTGLLSNSLNSVENIAVTNSMGKEVEFNYLDGQLDLSQNENGIYFIRYEVGQRRFCEKVILK